MNMDQKKKPELLLPAGNLDTLKTAIYYGADAVYIGGEAFSLRAKADNFGPEELREAVAYAHERGVRVYVTVNIFAHNSDIERAEPYIRLLSDIGPDALIVSDPGIFSMAREMAPELELHVSTQMNNTNYRDYLFWHALGAKRVVSARELSLSELMEIRKRIPEDMEIETFVHGAMCISYSGRCLLSAFLTGRDANRGACTHPCRWKYALCEEKREGQYFPIEEDEKGTYILNSKDLCMIGHIPELCGAGIDSFKIEGRMKTELYVATAARCYRKAIDDFYESPELYESRLPMYLEEIGKCTHREYTTGFFFGYPGNEAQIYDSSTYVKDTVYLGTVTDGESLSIGTAPEGYFALIQKNKFSVGDRLHVMHRDLKDEEAQVLDILDAESGEHMDSCPHAKQKLFVKLSLLPEKGEILRTDAKRE